MPGDTSCGPRGELRTKCLWEPDLLADRYDRYTGVAIDAQEPMKDARRAMKGLQSIHGLTRARTEGLAGLATRPDTESIGAVATHGDTAFHRAQLCEISGRTHSACSEPTRLSCSARRPLARAWLGQVLS
jgi:hypothetical protein